MRKFRFFFSHWVTQERDASILTIKQVRACSLIKLSKKMELLYNLSPKFCFTKDQEWECCSLCFTLCAGSSRSYHIHMDIQHPDVHMCLSSPSAVRVFVLARRAPSGDLSRAPLPRERRSKTKAMLLSGRKSLGTLTSHVDYINSNHPRICSWRPSTGIQPRGRREGCSSIGSWLD